MEILIFTIEVSQKIIIQKLSHEATKESIIIPTEVINIYSDYIMRLKTNMINYTTLTSEYNKTLRNPNSILGIWVNDSVQAK